MKLALFQFGSVVIDFPVVLTPLAGYTELTRF
jgi:hypothetical protein